jgi:hypothetical protein
MPSIESTESSSPIVTRAVSAGLRDVFCDNYQFPGWQKLLLRALGAFPQEVARFAISRFQSISGLNPNVLDNFSLDQLVEARINDYAGNAPRFPVVVFGAALGGATTYLSLALNGPFLPQTFVVTLRGGSFHGRADEYLSRSMDRALTIAADNPYVMTIQHYDPVHDGWLTRFVNHLRFKLLDLPPAYAAFLESRLEPGGAVVFLEGGASWLRYRIGPRSVFQVGGWGGIPAEEFLSGSLRLSAYARSVGLESTNWQLNGYPIEEGPESEWGSEPGLADALEIFCRTNGFRFIRLNLPHPNDFSRLAFSSAGKLLEKEGRTPSGTLIEMFTQFDASSALQAGLLPLWLIFNTEDSLRYLKKMVVRFPNERPVFFSPLATFSITPDLVPFKEWDAVLSKLDWINIGARSDHYPADARALVNWSDPLRHWVMQNRRPVRSHLSVDEIRLLVEDVLSWSDRDEDEDRGVNIKLDEEKVDHVK